MGGVGRGVGMPYILHVLDISLSHRENVRVLHILSLNIISPCQGSLFLDTVKPVLNGHLKEVKRKDFFQD